MNKLFLCIVVIFIVNSLFYSHIADSKYQSIIHEIGTAYLIFNKNNYEYCPTMWDDENQSNGTFIISKRNNTDCIIFTKKDKTTFEYYYYTDKDILILYSDTHLIGIYSNKENFSLIGGCYNASSTLIEYKNKPDLYNPVNLLSVGKIWDNNLLNFWVEGVKGYGYEEKIIISSFSSGKQIMAPHIVMCKIYGFIIFNGVFKNDDLYRKNSRVKNVTINYSHDISIEDTRQPQVFFLNDKSFSTDLIEFKIKDIYKGERWDDTCMTKLLFFSYDSPDIKSTPDL